MKPSLLHLEIGDTLPHRLETHAEYVEWIKTRQRKGKLGKNASSNSNTEFARAARLILNGVADREKRLSDPFEQARTFLQRKGMVIFSASIVGGPEDVFRVRGKDQPFSRLQIVELARAKGWRP